MLVSAFFLARLIVEWRRNRKTSGVVWRPYLVEPLRTGDKWVGRHLVDMVRSGAGVPMVYMRRPSLLANTLRRVRFRTILQDRTRKSVFEVASWRHVPASRMGSAVAFAGSAGSVLVLDLARRERREHFKRSLRAGVTGSRRPVVLATPDDLCDPAAWVRCVEVNGHRPVVDEQSRTGVCLVTWSIADPGSAAWSRVRQKDVPPHAMWLICDSDDQALPSHDWGETPESFAATPRPPSPLPDKDRLKEHSKWWRREKMALWVVLGLEPAALAIALALLVANGGLDRGLWAFAIAWLSVCALLLLNGLWSAATSAFSDCWWGRYMVPGIGEDTSAANWTGGTARGVFLCQLLQKASLTDTGEDSVFGAGSEPDEMSPAHPGP